MIANQQDSTNKYCVPFALSHLTGLSVGTCVTLLREHLGDQPVRGIFIPIALEILASKGFSFKRDNTADGESLRQLCYRVKGSGPYLISTGGHALIVDKNLIYDNSYKGGIHFLKYPWRYRIQQAYLISPSDNPSGSPSDKGDMKCQIK